MARTYFMPAHGRAPLPLLLGLFLAYTLAMPRPTVMTQPVRDEICQKLAEGNSLRSICLDESMPAISTVLLAVVQDRDGFSEQYMQARTAGGFSHADRIIDTVDRVATGEFDPQAARAMLDGLKWAAERMAPKSHSSRQEVDHTTAGQPMQQTQSAVLQALKAKHDAE